MATNEPIRNWKFVYTRLVGTIGEGDQAKEIRTSPVQSINGDIATTLIVDIGMRMLTPRELARAQGFPDTYLLTGTKTSQVARIGNSVCPHVAAAIVRANCVEGVPAL